MLKELNTDEAPEQGQWLSAFWKGEQAQLSKNAPRTTSRELVCLTSVDLTLTVPIYIFRRFPPPLPVSSLLPVQQLQSESGAQHPAEQECQGGDNE